MNEEKTTILIFHDERDNIDLVALITHDSDPNYNVFDALMKTAKSMREIAPQLNDEVTLRQWIDEWGEFAETLTEGVYAIDLIGIELNAGGADLLQIYANQENSILLPAVKREEATVG